MNYTDIAKFVHDSVKNPHKNNLASTQLKDHDVKIIKKVFLECELSDDVLSLGTLPLGFWG